MNDFVLQVSEWRHGEVSYDEAGTLVIKPLPEQVSPAADVDQAIEEEEEGDEEDEAGTASMLADGCDSHLCCSCLMYMHSMQCWSQVLSDLRASRSGLCRGDVLLSDTQHHRFCCICLPSSCSSSCVSLWCDVHHLGACLTHICP